MKIVNDTLREEREKMEDIFGNMKEELKATMQNNEVRWMKCEIINFPNIVFFYLLKSCIPPTIFRHYFYPVVIPMCMYKESVWCCQIWNNINMSLITWETCLMIMVAAVVVRAVTEHLIGVCILIYSILHDEFLLLSQWLTKETRRAEPNIWKFTPPN